MPNDTLQTVFSDATLGVIRTLLVAVIPDDYDWIPNTVITLAAVVDDIDSVSELTGPEKFDAVVTAVTAALDGVDDIPGWSGLTEESRDGLIESLAEITVFAVKAAQAGGLPEKSYQIAFADALRDLTLAIFELIETFDGEDAPSVSDVGASARASAASVVAQVRSNIG